MALRTAPAERLAQDLAQGLALYLHIPFCASRCPYCDFNTYAGIGHLLPSYLEALAREVQAWGEWLGRPRVRTVFLGGGTPSLLTPGQMGALLEAVARAFSLEAGAEVTVEANPDDASPDRFRGYRRAGVNRLSLGVQSLDDSLLALLGRRHSARQAVSAYWQAREAGFDNVNLDLMFGLPHQSMAQWEATLEGAVALAPEHLSAYCLTLEQGTPMERWVRQGRLPSPDPDLAADMWGRACQVLEGAGYHHYEVSNWARPGRASQHNLAYWHNRPYLGLGAGAHSYLAGLRFACVRSPRQFIRHAGVWALRPPSPLDAEGLRGMGVVAEVEEIGPRTEARETVALGLRLAEGLSWPALRHRLGQDLEPFLRQALADMEGLVELNPQGVRLTHRGWLLSNEVLSRLFARWPA